MKKLAIFGYAAEGKSFDENWDFRYLCLLTSLLRGVAVSVVPSRKLMEIGVRHVDKFKILLADGQGGRS